MKAKFYLIIAFSFANFFAIAQEKKTITFDELFRNSYDIFASLRQTNGIYRDALKLLEEDIFPGSTAACGVGLVSLCIADKKGWESDAYGKAKLTLQTLNGDIEGFKLLRSKVTGFPLHWFDMWNGNRSTWDPEKSSIDNALMVAGALFAKKYFNDPVIDELVNRLYNSTDWQAAIETDNQQRGGIFMKFDDDTGAGLTDAKTFPWNEYMLVAWLAHNASNGKATNATDHWNKWWADPDKSNVKKNDYVVDKVHDVKVSVLTDRGKDEFIPSFPIQFVYYLCHPASSSKYKKYFRNAMEADKAWWINENQNKNRPNCEWGCGAGPVDFGSGYNADAVNENDHHFVSPHIIAGSVPIYGSASVDQLLCLFENNLGVYYDQNCKPIIWRYKRDDPKWMAKEINAIDWTSMLFGLASNDPDIGHGFFETYNNFDFPEFKLELP